MYIYMYMHIIYIYIYIHVVLSPLARMAHAKLSRIQEQLSPIQRICASVNMSEPAKTVWPKCLPKCTCKDGLAKMIAKMLAVASILRSRLMGMMVWASRYRRIMPISAHLTPMRRLNRIKPISDAVGFQISLVLISRSRLIGMIVWASRYRWRCKSCSTTGCMPSRSAGQS